MKQEKTKSLSPSFAAVDALGAAADLAVNTVVEMAGADLTVKAINSLAPVGIVGTVKVCKADSNRVTLATRFRERRDDRVGNGCGLGPFVWDADGKAISRTPTLAATVTGTGTEPFLPVTGVTDMVRVKIGAGANQDFTLAPTDTTAALVAAKINATATGFVASAVAGAVRLAVSDIESDLEIVAITNDDYTELGFTAAVTEPTAASHDAGAIAGIVIKLPAAAGVTGTAAGPFVIVDGANDAVKVGIGSGDSQTFDLTAGAERTAAQVCADINATAVGFTAVVASGAKVRLVADNRWEAVEIEAVANDAYETLGLTAGITASPTTVETLEK